MKKKKKTPVACCILFVLWASLGDFYNKFYSRSNSWIVDIIRKLQLGYSVILRLLIVLEKKVSEFIVLALTSFHVNIF